MGGGNEEVMREFQAISDGGKANARNWSLRSFIPVFRLASPRADSEANQITIHFVDRRDATAIDTTVQFAIEKRGGSRSSNRHETGIGQNEEVE